MRRLGVALVAIACLLALASAEAAFGPLGQDTRVSFMGPNGDPGYDAFGAKVAYNPTADEYLVVWYGDDHTPPLVDNEREVFAQRLLGSGAPLGPRIRVSQQGADGNPASPAGDPSVAYNPYSNEYLVAWEGEIGTSDDVEIFARRLSATGERLGGSDDVQISHMGPGGGPNYNANIPSVAANPSTGEYLVVWTGDTNTMGLVDDEFEIFGQRLTAEGVDVPPDDFRISQQGADGNPDSGAHNPSVASNPSTNEYLVAWEGEIGTSGEFEIWAQLLTAEGGTSKDDFQLSDIGPNGNAASGAEDPVVATNPSTGEFLVVWEGDDSDDEFEIFGQLLTAAGAQTGANDFRISEQGADGDPASDAENTSVAYDAAAGEYLVVWSGDKRALLADGDHEVWAQRLSAAGAEVGGGDFQLSHMGPDGNPAYRAHGPAVASHQSAGEYFVVWQGDGDTPPLVDDEYEIFGRRLGVLAPTLETTDPPGPANNNNPRLKGSVAPDSTVDVFTNASCGGAPAVNDAPAGELNGAGIALAVADNSTTQFSATAASDGRTSRCSNSISYAELTPPPPPPPAADGVAPVVSGFSVSPRAFRLAAASAPRGSSFRFRLSERATARILLERTLPGRRLGRRCVAPTRKLRKRARCTRFKRTGTLTFRNRPAGANRIAFRGRIGRRALPRGSYRATITATDAAGNRSRPRRAGFRIVRR